MEITFPRKLRLLNSSHFNHVFQKPTMSRTTKITMFSRLNFLEYPRVGLVISKKYVKYSYKRNRIKRLIRESFRLQQHNLLYMDFVVIVTKEVAEEFNYHMFSEELEKLWHQYYHLSRE